MVSAWRSAAGRSRKAVEQILPSCRDECSEVDSDDGRGPAPPWRISLDCLYSGGQSARITSTDRALEVIRRLHNQPGGLALTRVEVRALEFADRACDRALRRFRAEGRIRRYGSGIYGVGRRARHGLRGRAPSARVTGLPRRLSRGAGKLIRPSQWDPDPGRSALPARDSRTRGADEARDTGRTVCAPEEGFGDRG